MSIQAPTTTTWTIDASHSLVELSVKHMMIATVKGRFAGVAGTIVVDDADPTRSSVEAEIDAATVDTRDEKRDAHLRSAEFLDVERYPTITFTSTRVERVTDDRAKLYGELTIRGTTRAVVLDTTFNGRGKNPWGQEVVGFTGETTINRKDFGLQWNVGLETGGVLVGDQVKIVLEIEAVKQG